ncbi:DUF6434 domain-containing protein [Pseudomonas sp. B21-048]|uniref:DUF6434 domain-containing protein n=1 Tax=Pseudomonas sp. B21-048 TaxID=2895490 RepID=UPI00216044C9|nr:DUF6434 domain-containing protein [Pseudomonas sp. B21-048]UVK96584.1 DUF6434 domain-containing protein [Pseudomonas sp. B21-048]
MSFNWHSDQLTRNTTICKNYRNTQNVRRFMMEHCGANFKLDRDFMAWIRNGVPKTLGEVVDEWLRRNRDAH